MHPLTPVDHLLALVLAVFFPIRSATFGYRRLERAADPEVPRVRAQLYGQAFLIQWGLSAVALTLWIVDARPWSTLGLAWRAHVWSLGVAALIALLAVMFALQIPRAARDPETLARVRERLRHIRRMMPESPGETRRFYLLAFTAGVCEELLYRGFLLDYLRHLLPWPAAAAIAVLLFGLGHSYQGPKGVLTTALAGAVLMAMVLVSGSLYLAMLAHMLLDAYSGTLGRLAFAAERASAAGPAPAAPVSGATPGAPPA